MKKIAITGGGGYIGSVLAGTLLRSGYDVTVIDRFFFGETPVARHQTNGAFHVLKKDVRDVTAADLEGIYAVCDLAALSNDPTGDIDPGLTREINVKGRANVAQAARDAGVQRYVLSSSCSVYGAGGDQVLNEEAECRPLTAYAESNARAEEAVLALSGQSFTTTVLRNATVFGLSPRMRFDLVINLMTLHAFERNRITVMGGGRQWRPLVHVSDVAAAFECVIGSDVHRVANGIFNVGIGNYQIRTLAAMIREILPFFVEITLAPDDPDKRNYNVSFDKIQSRLDFAPKAPISEGVMEIYEALKYGEVEATPVTSTLQWYRHILDAKKLIEDVQLEGRIL